MDKLVRERLITRTGLVGVATNLLLAAFKAAVGALSGSLAIVLDAVNNLSDVLSSVITIVGTKLGAKPADKDHPFGHGRYEYIAALLIAFLILAAGCVALYNSVLKILHPTQVNYGIWAFVVMGTAVVVKILLSRYTSKQGRRLDSGSLVASGTDAMFDAVVTGATLLSALIFLIFGLNLDAWIGLFISFIIIRGGFALVRDTISDILGHRPDAALSRSIKEDIAAFPGVGGAYDLSVNVYGPGRMSGSVDIEVPETMNAREIHELTLRIKEKILAKYGLHLYVGVCAERLDEANRTLKAQVVDFLSKNYPQVLQVHAFFLDEQRCRVQFDAVLDFSVKDGAAFCKELSEALQGAWPEYGFSINADSDLSD